MLGDAKSFGPRKCQWQTQIIQPGAASTLTKGFVCRNWCRRATAGYTDCSVAFGPKRGGAPAFGGGLGGTCIENS